MALRDIPTCFNVSYSKSFCVTGAILLRRFPVDELHFSFHAQHFAKLHGHFVWQEHFRRVALRVFCELHCQSCPKW